MIPIIRSRISARRMRADSSAAWWRRGISVSATRRKPFLPGPPPSPPPAPPRCRHRESAWAPRRRSRTPPPSPAAGLAKLTIVDCRLSIVDVRVSSFHFRVSGLHDLFQAIFHDQFRPEILDALKLDAASSSAWRGTKPTISLPTTCTPSAAASRPPPQRPWPGRWSRNRSGSSRPVPDCGLSIPLPSPSRREIRHSRLESSWRWLWPASTSGVFRLML